MSTAKTVEGQELMIKLDGNTVMINDANVTAADIATKNGVIHTIDTVLRPPAMQ